MGTRSDFQRNGREGGLAMFKAARLFSMAAMAFLLVSGTTTAFAASDAGKKKVTHASKTAPKSASRRIAPGGGGGPVYPSSTNY
jgi:hypothetical protein